MTLVPLTFAEITLAAHAGVMRNVTAIRDGRALEQGRSDTGFERHVLGAIGELAVGKATGRFWSPAVGMTDTLEGDLPGLHVKGTTRPDGCLIVRNHDPDDFPYVLVLMNTLPIVKVAGWIYGDEAKHERFWRERDPARGVHQAAYFVPQRELRELPLDD